MAVLSAIATSMITVTGVVFSVTVVALQLASSQFSPRVLRTFLRDRTVQVALGAFIASFIYALLVLRTVRTATPQQTAYVPRLSVSAAFLVLAFSLVMFVVYINHIAQSIRAARVIESIGDETRVVMRRMLEEVHERRAAPDPNHHAQREIVHSEQPGVVLAFDRHAIVRAAGRVDGCAFALVRPGDFVPTGMPLLELRWSGRTNGDGSREIATSLGKAVAVGRGPTLDQDPAFGFRQLVDIAIRALSPGVNDPTTAAQCLDQLHDLLRSSASRPWPSGLHDDEDGVLRFVESPRQWVELLDLALEEIVDAGAGSSQIHRRVRALLDDLAGVALAERRPAIRHQLARLPGVTAPRPVEVG